MADSTDYIITSAEQASQFCRKYNAAIPEDVFSNLEDVILGLSNSCAIPGGFIQKMEENLQTQKTFNDLLAKTAQRNNEGIAAEKNGNLEEAIRLYEDNIKDGYPATHSYDRLIILYHKYKDEQNELRVLNRAIEIFRAENEKRYSAAISNPNNKNFLPQLEAAMDSNQSLKNEKGMYIFSPYPVSKWISRKEKILAR